MKKTTKIVFCSVLLIVCCAGAAGVTTYLVNKKSKSTDHVYVTQSLVPYSSASSISMPPAPRNQPVDLTEAAEMTVHGVVHIKATVNGRTQTIQEMPDVLII